MNDFGGFAVGFPSSLDPNDSQNLYPNGIDQFIFYSPEIVYRFSTAFDYFGANSDCYEMERLRGSVTHQGAWSCFVWVIELFCQKIATECRWGSPFSGRSKHVGIGATPEGCGHATEPGGAENRAGLRESSIDAWQPIHGISRTGALGQCEASGSNRHGNLTAQANADAMVRKGRSNKFACLT